MKIDHNRKTADAKSNLLPNERLESFWDVQWLDIQPFSCEIHEIPWKSMEIHVEVQDRNYKIEFATE